jgi:hypothetical protein
MRRRSKVVRSRAGLVLGSAVMTLLLLPGAAFAGGFSGPRAGHHHAVGSGGSADLAIFLGIIAAAILSVLILSRIDANREAGRRAPNGIQRKPAGAGS